MFGEEEGKVREGMREVMEKFREVGMEDGEGEREEEGKGGGGKETEKEKGRANGGGKK